MLDQDRMEHLLTLFSIASLSEPVTKKLNGTFEDHITKYGLNTIEKCATDAAKVSIDSIVTGILEFPRKKIPNHFFVHCQSP